MRTHRQKSTSELNLEQKKNIFEQEEPQKIQEIGSQIKKQQVIRFEDQNPQTQSHVSKSHRIIGRFEESNEPQIIKQNDLYIGKLACQRRPTFQNMQEIPSFAQENSNKKTSKFRERVKNKKNLFENQQFDQDKQNKDISKQDFIYIPADLKSQKLTQIQNNNTNQNQKQNQSQSQNQIEKEDKFKIIQQEIQEQELDQNIKGNIFNIEEQVEKDQNQLTKTQYTSIAFSKIKIQIQESQQDQKDRPNNRLSQKSEAKQQEIFPKGTRQRSKSQKSKKTVRINLDQQAQQNNNQIIKLTKSLLKQQSLSLQQNALCIKRLFFEPIKNSNLFFKLKRVKQSFSESYELYLQGNKEPILHCKNKLGSIGSNYYISLTKEMNKKSLAFMGKLRGNVLGSEYAIYDSGLTPAANIQRKLWRATLGKIKYQSNFLGVNGPRKIQAFLPKPSTVEQLDSFKLSLEQQSVFTSSQACQKYRNKQPKWIKSHNSFGLNFGPRVKSASIKNFILIQENIFIEEEGENDIPNILTFGKVKENIFSLQVCHPLSILQAFAICVSQFDRKISCQ